VQVSHPSHTHGSAGSCAAACAAACGAAARRVAVPPPRGPGESTGRPAASAPVTAPGEGVSPSTEDLEKVSLAAPPHLSAQTPETLAIAPPTLFTGRPLALLKGGEPPPPLPMLPHIPATAVTASAEAPIHQPNPLPHTLPGPDRLHSHEQ
jgi:hypothetical protein